jgi:benzoyl-CoA 2,3-dioxygenase component B
MFVGESGVGRIIQRTCELMAQHKTDEVPRLRELGVIDLPTIQRYINFHSSVTVDLFGSDVSSNAATFYTTGLKGRYQEDKAVDDHVLKDQAYPVLEVTNGTLQTRGAPALNALNERLRDDFMKDSTAGIDRWNRIIQKHGVDFRLSVPHKAFHRQIGPLAGVRISPEGRLVAQGEWDARVKDWLPSEHDAQFVRSLMGRVVEPGKYANWIAPPQVGINKQPADFQYIRFN